MEYTHVENIDGMALTNAAYARRWPRFEDFPTTARGCATRAASMIKAGFVIHDPFDSCFKMGHGFDVMNLLVIDALADAELRTAWNRCAYYVGTFEAALTEYRARLDQPITPSGQMQMAL
jgi:hypothetical protein